MKRLRVFLFRNELATGSRRLLAVLTAGFLALAPFRSATAQPAENRSPAPEPIPAAGGDSPLEDPHWLDPELPSTPKRPAVTKSQEKDARLPDSPPPRNPTRSTVVRSQGEDELLPDSPPPRNPKRSAVARSQDIDAEPPADESCADEDGDACQDCGRCPRRPWGPGSCWQPFANRVEARGEWLFWWGKGNFVPPLVTSGPTTQTQSQAGVLGAPGTQILLGNSEMSSRRSSIQKERFP